MEQLTLNDASTEYGLNCYVNNPDVSIKEAFTAGAEWQKEQFIAGIKEAAKILIDTDRESEYTRGICELIADVDGIEDIPHDMRSKDIAIELGVQSNVASAMW